jgi:hypothetical protein
MRLNCVTADERPGLRRPLRDHRYGRGQIAAKQSTAAAGPARGFPPSSWVFPRHLFTFRRESVQLFSLLYFGFRGRAECCNILHVCRCQGWNKASVQANFCPAASKPCPPVVRAVWVRPAAQLFIPAAVSSRQCSSSPMEETS